MRIFTHHLLWLALPLVVTACQDTDPFRAQYKWRPDGVVDGNMAAMASNPMDLVHGRGTPDSDGGRAAAAIDYWTKVGPGTGSGLSNTASNSSGGGGGGSSGGSGGGTSGGT